MPIKRHVTAGTKKLIAGQQRYTCAANVKDYECPLKGQPFDESGYEIDHIRSLEDEGTNDKSNLQALCLMCHRVKSNRASVGKPKKPVEKKKPKKEGFVYTGPTMSDSESEEEEQICYWPDDAEKKPSKIRWKKGSDSIKFIVWRQQYGYSQSPDTDGNYVKQC